MTGPRWVLQKRGSKEMVFQVSGRRVIPGQFLGGNKD